MEACRRVGKSRNISIAEPPAPCSAEHPAEAIRLIARCSAFFPRRVKLIGDWYKRDCGKLVGFFGSECLPVSLMPQPSGGYNLIDSRNGTVHPIDPATAKKLLPEAFMLYRILPDKPVSVGKFVRFILPGSSRELWAIAGAGFGSALLSFAFPLMLGMMIDSVIPHAQQSGVYQIALGLLVVVLAMALFSATRSFALVRFEGRIDSTVQAAIWQRLLSLPIDFFSRFTAGDLAFRSMGINAIRNILTGLTINSAM
ncbi:MAG: hypothetical protein DRP42_07445, partial [Tenericutes bacterium]